MKTPFRSLSKYANKPSSGPWYAIPTKVGKWKILSLRDDEMTVDHDHEDLWRKYVCYILSKDFKLTPDQVAILVPNNLGLPRGRVIEPISEGEDWKVEYANDLPDENLKNNILSDFGLVTLSLADKVKWKVVEDKQMNLNEKEIVLKVLEKEKVK